MKKTWFLLILSSLLISACIPKKELPLKFVYLHNIDKTIIEHPRYFSSENFIGHKVPGYTSPHIIASEKAARQLKLANQYFKTQGYQLVVYDGYRPQTAVDCFYDWSKNMFTENKRRKSFYYPTLSKKELSGSYIKYHRSSHSRGSTFDLTLIKYGTKPTSIEPKPRILNNGQHILYLDDQTVDMGSSFDLFHPASKPDSKLISTKAQNNRAFLSEGMQKFGFKPYAYEWWHFQLIDEPYPNTYFDFF